MSSPTAAPAADPTQTNNNNGGGGGGNAGPTSSPLLFFVALGFGVVFTNLWYVSCLAKSRLHAAAISDLLQDHRRCQILLSIQPAQSSPAT